VLELRGAAHLSGDEDHRSGGLRRLRAKQLRPSRAEVKTKDLPRGAIGVRVGRQRKIDLIASWEDVAVAVLAARSGESTSLAVPATLDAPGAVVTSNKPDVWGATATLRAQDTGEQVWTFDPQQVARAPQAVVEPATRHDNGRGSRTVRIALRPHRRSQ
jgi:hypothetical protein